jgi:ubiquinone/menaquinone biosynthesis C-methylase UbiE
MTDDLKALVPLIVKKSNISDPEKFQSIINVVFHDHEAKHYDVIHSEMWKSLPKQFELLANDLAPYIKNQENLKLLDVGCGTGMATQMMLNTKLNKNVREVHLLDTSSVMLSAAGKRARKWGKITKLVHGDIKKLEGKYDIIIISSVLHHIPNIPGFLKTIEGLQQKGCVILTIHDPGHEALNGTVYQERCKLLSNTGQAKTPKLSILTRIFNKVRRSLQPKDYIDSINETLLKKGVINTPLTARELWSITDIHVEDLPYSASDGISLSTLKDSLPSYQLISFRTYAFFGTVESNLPPSLHHLEVDLSKKRDLNGRNFCSIWLKN